MKRIYASVIGIEQGTALIFSDFESGGPMWSGKGRRQSIKSILFSESFKTQPSVFVTMEMWDLDKGTNQRAELVSENVTNESFDIVFSTWGDTKIARIRANWIAIGEVSAQDDWSI